MVKWKSLIILKEVMKSSGKYLRVCARNQWDWNLVRKIWNLPIKISIENCLFIHFKFHLPGSLSFYTALGNNTIFQQQLFLVSGGRWKLPHPLCGTPVAIDHFQCSHWKLNNLVHLIAQPTLPVISHFPSYSVRSAHQNANSSEFTRV